MQQIKREITCIVLETSTTCNARCKFCPTSKLKPEIMSQTLFYKIIDDLKNMNFTGKILPYDRNEPLTDPFIFERLGYIRRKLPKAKIFFSTNGFLLNKHKINSLLELQPIEIRISLHAFSREKCQEIMGIDNTRIFENIEHLYKQVRERKIENPTEKFYLVMVSPSKKEETLMKEYFQTSGYFKCFDLQIWPLVSRAGNVKYAQIGKKKIHHKKIIGCKQGGEENCINSWFLIHTNGKVVLCCQDWFQEVVLGNMNSQTINEVWNEKRYLNTLNKVFGRIESEPNFICKRCDSAIPAPGIMDKFVNSYIIRKSKAIIPADIKRKIKHLIGLHQMTR